MGLFRGKDVDAQREKELAKALALRRVTVTGTVVSVEETGRTRSDGAAREIRFAVRFKAGDGPTRFSRPRVMAHVRMTLRSISQGCRGQSPRGAAEPLGSIALVLAR